MAQYEQDTATAHRDMTFSDKLSDLSEANQRLIEAVQVLHVKLMGSRPEKAEASSGSNGPVASGLVPNIMRHAQDLISKNHNATDLVEDLIRSM